MTHHINCVYCGDQIVEAPAGFDPECEYCCERCFRITLESQPAYIAKREDDMYEVMLPVDNGQVSYRTDTMEDAVRFTISAGATVCQ